MKKYLLFSGIKLAIIIAVICVISYNNSNNMEASIARASVNPNVRTYMLKKGQTDLLPYSKVVAKSSDTDIASVDKNGVITAAKDGECYVTYKEGQFPFNLLFNNYSTVKVIVSSDYDDEGIIDLGSRKIDIKEIQKRQKEYIDSISSDASIENDYSFAESEEDFQAIYDELSEKLAQIS